MLNPILYILVMAINLYVVILFVYIILSLAVQFKIVNIHQQFVRVVHDVLCQLVEPVLKKIRYYLPWRMGSVDLSPVILFMALNLLEYSIYYFFAVR